MLKHKEKLLKQIEDVEKTQKEGIAQIGRLKYQIDLKINRILQLLETQPTRNATETVHKYGPQDRRQNDIKVAQNLNNEPTNSIVMLDKSTQIYQSENHKAQQQLVIQKSTKQMEKQIGEESESSVSSSTNEFLSMKLSNESSNVELYRNPLEVQDKIYIRHQLSQPLQFRHCESKSQGGEDLDLQKRISEVPEELEDEPEQPSHQCFEFKKFPKQRIENERKQNIQSDLIINKQKNYNISKRSKTAYQFNYPLRISKNNKNSQFYWEDQFQQYVFTMRNYKEHKSSLCSVRTLMNNLNKKEEAKSERNRPIPEKTQDLMKKDYEHFLRKRRRQTESGQKLRENLLAKFRYNMKKKEPSMRF